MTDENYERRSLVGVEVTRKNLFLNRLLEDIGDIAGDEDLDGDDAVERIRDVLLRQYPGHIGPPEMIRAPFTWRAPEQKKGLYEAFPGDGFGFAEYVEGFGLRMQFQCAGVLACADLSLEALKHTMAEEGFSIWPMVCEETERFADPVIKDLRTRIGYLERELKSAEAEVDRLMGLHYGEGDERDHLRVAVDRAATLDPDALRPGDKVELEPAVAVRKRASDDQPVALCCRIPLPGFPGHNGAVYEFLEACKVWGIDLQRPSVALTPDTDRQHAAFCNLLFELGEKAVQFAGSANAGTLTYGITMSDYRVTIEAREQTAETDDEHEAETDTGYWKEG